MAPWQRDINSYPTTIDGGGMGTVITFSAGSPLLEGFTITGGAASDGAGVIISGASPVISATTIVSNHGRVIRRRALYG